MKVDSKITAQKIFEMVKANLPDQKKITITSDIVQDEFDYITETIGYNEFELGAINGAISLINDYFKVNISDE